MCCIVATRVKTNEKHTHTFLPFFIQQNNKDFSPARLNIISLLICYLFKAIVTLPGIVSRLVQQTGHCNLDRIEVRWRRRSDDEGGGLGGTGGNGKGGPPGTLKLPRWASCPKWTNWAIECGSWWRVGSEWRWLSLLEQLSMALTTCWNRWTIWTRKDRQTIVKSKTMLDYFEYNCKGQPASSEWQFETWNEWRPAARRRWKESSLSKLIELSSLLQLLFTTELEQPHTMSSASSIALISDKRKLSIPSTTFSIFLFPLGRTSSIHQLMDRSLIVYWTF